MDISKINLDLTQLYLEMARSVFTKVYFAGDRPPELVLLTDGIEPALGIEFALTSVTIIYTYLSLEAFANYYLYFIWEACKAFYEVSECQKQKHPAPNKKMIPPYHSFYQKYGHYDKFEELKKTDLRDLDTRIKVLCEAFEIRKIHEVNVRLWQQFKGLLKQARHFLVHPFPDPTKFPKMMDTLLRDTKGGEYVQIAQDIIKHFYKETRAEMPEWVEKNTLFSIGGFEYLHKKNC